MYGYAIRCSGKYWTGPHHTVAGTADEVMDSVSVCMNYKIDIPMVKQRI